MGLDNYASRTQDEVTLTAADRQAFSDAGIELCSGLFSGDPGSFRGKMYDTLLLDVTGVSPLQQWIPPDTIREMYTALLNCDPVKLLESYQQMYADLDQDYRGSTLEELSTEIIELRKFFQVCAERGLGLIGRF